MLSDHLRRLYVLEGAVTIALTLTLAEQPVDATVARATRGIEVGLDNQGGIFATPIVDGSAETSVTLSSPESGSTFVAPTEVPITAVVEATVADGFTSVEFYAGDELIDTAYQPPYTVIWNVTTPGEYALTAIGRNIRGAPTYSTQVSVSVKSGGQLAALPRIERTTLVYQGAFRVPNGQLGTSSFDYAWKGLAFNPTRNSLFMAGHDWQQQVAEIGIPDVRASTSISDLAVASLLQEFGDPTDGKRSMVGTAPGTDVKVGGVLVYKDELFSSAYIYYDANGSQQTSHFRNGLNLADKTDARGPYKVGSVRAGLVSGYMGLIPQDWQAALGGTALTGNCCLSIISRTSYGPAAFAFDPATLGTQTVRASPLVYYDADHTTLGPWAGSNPLYGSTTEIGGVVFPEGTRSVLFFGVNGQGTHCYGDGTSENPPPAGQCYDPTTTDKGGHAYPYVYQVWAYDALDLAAVKAGKRRPWDVEPYAYWTLALPHQGEVGMPRITGAAYDPATRRIFLSAARGDQKFPVVHVFTLAQ